MVRPKMEADYSKQHGYSDSLRDAQIVRLDLQTNKGQSFLSSPFTFILFDHTDFEIRTSIVIPSFVLRHLLRHFRSGFQLGLFLRFDLNTRELQSALLTSRQGWDHA